MRECFNKYLVNDGKGGAIPCSQLYDCDTCAYTKQEQINHPTRYGGDTTYECIKVLKAWLTPDEYRGFLRGNAIKYICRLGKKDEATQEIKKAQWYLEELKKTYENKQQEAE